MVVYEVVLHDKPDGKDGFSFHEDGTPCELFSEYSQAKLYIEKLTEGKGFYWAGTDECLIWTWANVKRLTVCVYRIRERKVHDEQPY